MSEIPADIADLRSVAQFRDWVVWTDEAVDDYFIGFCPFHDPQRLREGSAEFNFKKGVVRCITGPEGKCHPGKRVMSMSNMFAAMKE